MIINYELAAILACATVVIVVFALWRSDKVGFKLNKCGATLTAEKNLDKDAVTVRKISESKVGIKNRSGQITHVEDVSKGSEIKIG